MTAIDADLWFVVTIGFDFDSGGRTMKFGNRGLLGLTAFIVAAGLFLSATGDSVALAAGGGFQYWLL